MDKEKKIVCAHLLNDFSGSPSVLAEALNALSGMGHEIDLYTSEGPGMLDKARVNVIPHWYRWSPSKYMRLLNYSISQGLLFFRLLKYWRQPIVIYANTLLPAGAAWAGKLMGKEVVYHIHETHIDPPAFNTLLVKTVQATADKVVYVSEFLASHHTFSEKDFHIIYNSLSEKYSQKAKEENLSTNDKDEFEVLMLCSLRKLKGIFEYIQLANQLPDIQFTLVISQPMEEIERYFADENIPANLTLVPAQTDVHPYYEKADLLLNLSHPEKLTETFGMTIIEGLSYGLPAIVPPVGGPREIISHQKDGYHMDSRDLPPIVNQIDQLHKKPELYQKLSFQARKKAQKFSSEIFRKGLRKVFG